MKTLPRLMMLFAVMPLLGLLVSSCGPIPSGAVGSTQTSNSMVCSSQFMPIDYIMERVYKDFTVDPPMFYHERIWHRMDHQYHIECSAIYRLIDGEMISVTPSELAAYNQLLTQGHGYYSVFGRGFQITDPELFLLNYNYTILGMNMPCIGRKATVAHVVPKMQDRPNFFVWIDQTTGLVLKYVEETLAMSPTSILEVETLNLNPDFSMVTLHQRDLSVESIDLISANKQFGFPVFKPRYLPSGFVLSEVSKVTIPRQLDDDIVTFRLTYHDGIQELSLFQYHRLDIPVGTIPPAVVSNVRINFATKAGLMTTHFRQGFTEFLLRASQLDQNELATVIQSLTTIL